MTSAKFNLLDTYNAASLFTLAEAANLPTKQGNKKLTKGLLMILMEKEYFTEARIKASLKHLSPLEKQVLERIQHRQGPVPAVSLRRELLRASIIEESPKSGKKTGYGAEKSYSGSPYVKTHYFEDILAYLTYHGLVFSYRDESDYSNSYKFELNPGSTLYIPPFVQQHLPEPAPLPLKETWLPSITRIGSPDLLFRELYLYWDFVRREPIPLLKSGFVGKRNLKQINSQLLFPDATLDTARQEDEMPHLYLLRLMLQELELVRNQANLLEVPEKDRLEGAAFWQLSQTEMVQKYLAAQMNLTQTNELPQDRLGYFPKLVPARHLMMERLKNKPLNAWLEVDTLLEEMQNHDNNFLFAYRTDVEKQRYGSGYYGFGIYYYGDRQGFTQKLQGIEEQFVKGVIETFLFSLGLVELGYESEAAAAKNQWGVFRLTPLAAAAFGKLSPDTSTTQDEGRLIIQPNFQLLALGPVPLAMLAKLDLFAARQKVDRGVVEYQLSRESVYASQQAGFTVPQIIALLTEVSGQTLPQNVHRSLEEWGAHHNRIVFRQSALLVQTINSDLLTQLMAQKEIGQFLARPLTPDIALVTGKKKPVVAALLAAELLPAVSTITPEAADNSVVIDAQGRVEAVHAVPGLHVSGRVSRLAEETEPRRWQITEKKIQQAGGSKKKVEAILAELTRLNRGSLPESLVTQIKAWGGYYGAAAVETLTLVEFRDKEALHELMKHAGLRPHLHPFTTQDRALAVISKESLKQVKKILAELGMPITEQVRR